MKNFYEIDHLGKMELLSNLQCFCSVEKIETKGYNVTIEIRTTNKDEAKKVHPMVHSVLKELAHYDQIAKEKLKELYNPTEKELAEITVNHLVFNLNNDFELWYNLPEGSAVEYLSITFSEQGIIIGNGGGNY